MEAIAKLNNVPIAPRKMRMVVDLIRGEKVGRALSILKFQSKSGAPLVEKLLLSAVANWENKFPDAQQLEIFLFLRKDLPLPLVALKIIKGFLTIQTLVECFTRSGSELRAHFSVVGTAVRTLDIGFFFLHGIHPFLNLRRSNTIFLKFGFGRFAHPLCSPWGYKRCFNDYRIVFILF